MVPPKIMNTDTPNTSKNSRPLVFFARAASPDSKAPVTFTTPIRPPKHRMNTMTSMPSMTPHTMEYGMSAMDTGCGSSPS